MDLSDAQLVVLVARAEGFALAELYRRHGRSVYGLAKRVTGGVAEGEDVTQEVFLHLWRHPERFDPGRGSLRTYLMTQAHRRAVDAVRSQIARHRREEADGRAGDGGLDLEREVWDFTVAAQVTDALASLPADERRAIELAYFDGHTYRQVAQLLDQPEGTIKGRIRSGLGRMRSALSDERVRHERF
jgi:RNA polymerase sigma-70 factor, ECF subfamily